MLELQINHLFTLFVNLAIVVSIIQSNRTTVAHLRTQNDELKNWLSKLQDTVNDLRAKVGH